MSFYRTLAVAVLALHLAWCAWIVFGWLLTRGRRRLRFAHIGSLVYSIFIETAPVPCPLTLAEQWCESRAGIIPYREPFLVHYLEAAIYPDVPNAVLVPVAVLVCLILLGIYVRRFVRRNGANW
ncbi:MAG TPA: DUF2784 family protein [Methylomirabilota bacterium]|nr:DUF2784 family protein [Methylomirabilota bacterium]